MRFLLLLGAPVRARDTALLAALLGAACSPPQATPVEAIELSTDDQRPVIDLATVDPIERPLALSPQNAQLLEVPDLSWDGSPIPDLGDSWVHPLAGERILPDSEGHAFGAFREGDRPRECGRGHCGVDLGHERGAIVHAVRTGTVRSVVRRPRGRAGMFVSIDHDHGVRTFYMHLDWIRADLDTGQTIRAGEPLGTVGSTGVISSGPHLHFAMSHRLGDQMWFVDPEPMLRQALTHQGPTTLAADAALDAVLANDTPAPDTGGIALEVRDAHTREALDGVRVRGRGPDGATLDTVVTGGYAELTTLAPGRWKLTLSRPGHSRARASFEVPAGAGRITVHNARVELRRGAILAGTVRDDNGDRVAGAKVTIGGVSTTTDRYGEFRLRDAPTGTRRIEAEHGDLAGSEELTLDPGDERVTLELTIYPD